MECCICQASANQFRVPMEMVLALFYSDREVLKAYQFHVQCSQCVDGLYCSNCFKTHIQYRNNCAVCRVDFKSKRHKKGFFQVEQDSTNNESHVFLYFGDSYQDDQWEHTYQLDVVDGRSDIDLQTELKATCFASPSASEVVKGQFQFQIQLPDMEVLTFPTGFTSYLKTKIVANINNIFREHVLTYETVLLETEASFEFPAFLFNMLVWPENQETSDNQSQLVAVYLFQCRQSDQVVNMQFLVVLESELPEAFFNEELKKMNVEGLTRLQLCYDIQEQEEQENEESQWETSSEHTADYEV